MFNNNLFDLNFDFLYAMIEKNKGGLNVGRYELNDADNKVFYVSKQNIKKIRILKFFISMLILRYY